MHKAHEHLFKNLTAARKCVKALDEMDIVITSLNLSGSKPRVVVVNDAKCRQLKAVGRTFKNSHFNHERCMTTVLEGCQVDYTVRGH